MTDKEFELLEKGIYVRNEHQPCLVVETTYELTPKDYPHHREFTKKTNDASDYYWSTLTTVMNKPLRRNPEEMIICALDSLYAGRKDLQSLLKLDPILSCDLNIEYSLKLIEYSIIEGSIGLLVNYGMFEDRIDAPVMEKTCKIVDQILEEENIHARWMLFGRDRGNQVEKHDQLKDEYFKFMRSGPGMKTLYDPEKKWKQYIDETGLNLLRKSYGWGLGITKI